MICTIDLKSLEYAGGFFDEYDRLMFLLDDKFAVGRMPEKSMLVADSAAEVKEILLKMFSGNRYTSPVTEELER